jgi:uncharacterized membrane protein
MEWLHPVEEALAEVVHLAEFCLEAIAAFCVILGVIKTIQLALKLNRQTNAEFPFIQLRIGFGVWLALALEFQLASDILNTAIAPSLEALAQLAIIAVIRTFLNFSLTKEMTEQFELREKAIEHHNHKLMDDSTSETL